MYKEDSLIALYQRELSLRNISENESKFLLDLIKESPLDNNLYVMNNSSYRALRNRGLWEVFEEINNANHIEWTHSNDPIR